MVAIKDMEMPRWCGECEMCKEETIEGDTSTYCELLNQDIIWNGNRVENCPLVEIEEHTSHNAVKIFDVEKLNGLFPRNKQEQNTEWTSTTKE